jgi:ENTS family enterobactin (siderophore) exporter
VGDAVSVTALPLLVLALTGSGLVMGSVAAIQAFADFLSGLFAGAIADRGDRKRMMVGADLGRALLTALIPLSVLLGGPTMVIVVAVAAPMSVLRSLFMAGYIASVPALVGRSHLARANGIVETVASASFVIGPLVAGVLAASIGPGPTLAIDALSFAISSLGLFLVRRPLRAPADRPPSRIVDDIREGFRYVARDPVLRAAILLFGLGTMALSPLGVALTVRITRDLGLSAAALGVVLAAFSIGTIGGGLAASRLGRHVNVAAVLLAALAGLGLGNVGVAGFDQPPLFVASALAAGIAESVLVVTYVTLRTTYSPDRLLGRIGSTARVISLGLQPIGLLIGGFLIDAIGGTATMAVMGIALCLLAIAFVPVRALRTASLAPRPSASALSPG